MSAAPDQRDGRTVRAERTRQALVDSLLGLLDEGQMTPTAAAIAARAGVSERSVFQHFPDREALLEAVAREQYDRVVPTLRPIDSSLPLSERIEQFAQHPDHEIITSFPGLADISAAIVLAEIGDDRSRFGAPGTSACWPAACR